MLVTACKHNDDTLLVNFTGTTAPIASNGYLRRGASLLAAEGKAKLYLNSLAELERASIN